MAEGHVEIRMVSKASSCVAYRVPVEAVLCCSNFALVDGQGYGTIHRLGGFHCE